MKNYLIVFALMFNFYGAVAQKELVKLDEQNKYIFYQVTEMPGLSADTLYKRCYEGISKIKPKPDGKPVAVHNTSIVVKSKTMLYSSMTNVKHEDGELTYSLNIEFKDAKYRYWLTDFILMPYQRNRYGTFERKPGVEIPLERIKEKFDSRTLDNYLEQIAAFGKKTGDLLKTYTSDPKKMVIEPTKVNVKNW